MSIPISITSSMSQPNANVHVADQAGMREDVIHDLRQLIESTSSESATGGFDTCKKLRQLKKTYLDISQIVGEATEKEREYLELIDSTVFTILRESYGQMSVQQLIEQLAHLPTPRSSNYQEDIELAILLYQEIASNQPADALQALGKWVSSSNLPLVDLNWSLPDLLKLAAYLETLNFTPSLSTSNSQNQLSSQKITTLIGAAPGIKNLTFYYNSINLQITEKLAACGKLETLTLINSKIEEKAQLSFPFPKLKRLEIDRLRDFNQEIDLGSCRDLHTFSLAGCEEFNGALSFPLQTRLHYFAIENCPSWNQPLNLSGFQQLKKIKVVLNEQFNQPVNLQAAVDLEYIEISSCLKWNGPLVVPPSDKLYRVSLSECRQFNHPLSFESNPNLKAVDLTNCRKFNSPLLFHKSSSVETLLLLNCFNFNQVLSFVNNSHIKKINLRNCTSLKSPILFHKSSHLEELDLTNCAAFNKTRPDVKVDKLTE